jgi:hypothetical protein
MQDLCKIGYNKHMRLPYIKHSHVLSLLLIGVLIFFSGIIDTVYGQSTLAACTFNRNLGLGMSGADVQRLQKILNRDPATRVAVSGAGSPGKETTLFDRATYQAVIKFQNKYRSNILVVAGLSKGNGFVGALTRSKLTALCRTSEVAVTPQPLAPQPVIPQPQPPVPQPLVPIQPIAPVDNGIASASCQASPQSASTGQSVSWTVTSQGMTNPSYTWSGSDLLSGNSSQVASTYITPGTKSARVTLSANGKTITAACSVGITQASLQPLTYAQAWTPSRQSGTQNLIPMYWVYPWNIQDVSGAKAALDAQPAGRKTIIITEHLKALGKHSRDSTIWWDTSVMETKNILGRFFSELKSQGGQVDYIVLDYEDGMSNWHLPPSESYETSVYKKIEEDPRFPAIKSQLTSLGYPSEASLEKVWDFRSGDYYLIWNEVMGHRLSEYLTEAVFNAARPYFPNIKGSNYGELYHSNTYPIPEINGHKIYKYGTGTVTGGYQSPVLYGSLGQIVDQGVPGLVPYPKTVFNALKYDINLVRSAKLLGSEPIAPWIPWRSFTEGPSNLYFNNDYYQEMLYHALLTGVDQVLLWNPYASQSEDKLVSDILSEFDNLTGSSRTTTITNLVPWNADYILSGMRSGEYTMWRFSSAVPITSAAISTSNTQVTVRSLTKQITFSNAFIYTPSQNLGPQGVWIIQKGSPQFTEQ